MTIWAPGTTAPDGSRTVPAMEAVALPWPMAEFGKKSTFKTSTHNQTRNATLRCLFTNRLVVSIGHLLNNWKNLSISWFRNPLRQQWPNPGFNERRHSG